MKAFSFSEKENPWEKKNNLRLKEWFLIELFPKKFG